MRLILLLPAVPFSVSASFRRDAFTSSSSVDCSNKPTFCSGVWDPVCADGKTFANPCEHSRAVCNGEAPRAHFKKVCGNNGVTYENMCQFEAAQCRGEVSSVTSDSECATYDVEPAQPVEPNAACTPVGLRHTSEDNCMHCECSSDRTWLCSAVGCAALACPQEHWLSVEGACCPVCSTEWSCQCTDDGTSGGVDVDYSGCAAHEPGFGAFCYVREPAFCVTAKPSERFEGAAWKKCAPNQEEASPRSTLGRASPSP
ncbi:MAG: hypothetical protein MHM6MM_003009 [Cercozoa sp. M6MM]